MNLIEYTTHGFDYYKHHLGKLVLISKPYVFSQENETNKILFPKKLIDKMIETNSKDINIEFLSTKDCFYINKPTIAVLTDAQSYKGLYMFGFLIERKVFYLIRRDPMYLIKYVKLL